MLFPFFLLDLSTPFDVRIEAATRESSEAEKIKKIRGDSFREL
jgi:hypothetical protein